MSVSRNTNAAVNVNTMVDTLGLYDPEIAAVVAEELARQRDGLELIASENVVSEAVMLAMGSPLTNKYAEGYPAKRYYGGCYVVDKAENIAIERAKKLFGAEHVSQKRLCILRGDALLPPPKLRMYKQQ